MNTKSDNQIILESVVQGAKSKVERLHHIIKKIGKLEKHLNKAGFELKIKLKDKSLLDEYLSN